METQEQTLHRQEQDRSCTARKRALETQEQTLHRQEQDRSCTARKRALETEEQTLHRQEQDRSCTARKRALETQEQTLRRQEQNRSCTARKRASESPMENLRRKQCNKRALAQKRGLSVSVESAIAAFHMEMKSGPDYVCTCCHCMMYKKSVVPCNREKYSKANKSVFQQVFNANFTYTSSDSKLWVCKTCDRALTRGNMPLQAKANGLGLSPIPLELSSLNCLN